MFPRSLSLAITLAACPLAYTQTLSNGEKKQFVLLINQVPRQSDISSYLQVINPAQHELTPSGKEFEFKRATEGIEMMKNAIPKLRKLIKPGTSMFTYPGLLSRGYIRYDKNEKYVMYIGAYFRHTEGSGPYDFEIFFNESGRITAVKGVIYKS